MVSDIFGLCNITLDHGGKWNCHKTYQRGAVVCSVSQRHWGQKAARTCKIGGTGYLRSFTQIIFMHLMNAWFLKMSQKRNLLIYKELCNQRLRFWTFSLSQCRTSRFIFFTKSPCRHVFTSLSFQMSRLLQCSECMPPASHARYIFPITLNLSLTETPGSTLLALRTALSSCGRRKSMYSIKSLIYISTNLTFTDACLC